MRLHLPRGMIGCRFHCWTSIGKISVKDKRRPVNVGITDLMVFRWPVTAVVSITHRVGGLVLFVGVAFGLFALDLSLSGEEGFNRLGEIAATPLGKLISWGLLSALAYHFVAGIRHLLMDAGIGETLEGGRLAACSTLVISGILIVLAAVWVV